MSDYTAACAFAKELQGFCFNRLPPALNKLAKELGIVVVYGVSDDLMKVEGAVNDECGVNNGGVGALTRKGFLPSWESIREDVSVD